MLLSSRYAVYSVIWMFEQNCEVNSGYLHTSVALSWLLGQVTDKKFRWFGWSHSYRKASPGRLNATRRKGTREVQGPPLSIRRARAAEIAHWYGSIRCLWRGPRSLGELIWVGECNWVLVSIHSQTPQYPSENINVCKYQSVLSIVCELICILGKSYSLALACLALVFKLELLGGLC